MRPFIAILFLAATGTTVTAQDADQTIEQNWSRLSHAMVQLLLDRDAGRAVEPDAFFTALTDLNLDGNADLLVYRDPADCTEQPCGQFGYVLLKDRFVQVMPDIPGMRQDPALQVDFGTDRHFGFLDMVYGPVHLVWNGGAYVERGSMPAASLDAGRFIAACERSAMNDWSFNNNGVDPAEGRKTICGCFAGRASAHGADQAMLDTYADYLDNEDADSSTLSERLGSFATEAAAIHRGCLVERGWATWDWQLGEQDERQAQQPLDFSGFLPACSSQNWLVSNQRVGAPDRALAICGCLGRTLAARGFDQTALDGVSRLYSGDIGEEELGAIRADALDASDADLETCLMSLPAG